MTEYFVGLLELVLGYITSRETELLIFMTVPFYFPFDQRNRNS
jgi:hypothetical protein